MKNVTISSPWKPENTEVPLLNEYPRPELIRGDWLNLNGYWEYAVIRGKNTTVPSKWNGRILVPFAIETALSGVRRSLSPEEELWYRRRFSLSSGWKGKSIRLNFEAVDYSCECLINGKSVGAHQGGYHPFSFDITKALNEGDNIIELRVADPTDCGMQPRGKQARNPGQIWYEPTSGIWQTVWLEPVSKEGHISGAGCSWEQKTQMLELRLAAEHAGPGPYSYRAELSGPDGGVVAGIDSSDGNFSFKVPRPELWSPESPSIYSLKLQMYKDGVLLDEVESYTALRTVGTAETAGGQRVISLNGNPLFINALLDQGYWPESGLTAPDDKALIFDIEETKKLGFNCLRKHIKIESRRWYYHADRLGMLVIQDMVSGGKSWTNACLQIAFGLRRKDNNRAVYRKSGRAESSVRDEYEKSIEAALQHLGSHPSIICWVPFNESWGQYDALRIGNRIKELDPGRLVDHSSGWVDQGGGDFYSVHRYVLKLRPKPPNEPRLHMISEFGGYNLSIPGHMWDDRQKFGYGFHDSRRTLADAYEKLIRTQLIPLIKKGLCAAVYTQLSDVETESNGLFTYDRRVLKFDQTQLESLNNEIYAVFDSIQKPKGE